MKRSLTSQRGMSLVEASIILMVLMLLTSVLAPSMGDFIVDAKMVKVKEDCEAIGLTVMRLVRDVGPCLHPSEYYDHCVEAVYSPGASGDFDWPKEGASMVEQFVTNDHDGAALYKVPGWRGGYLSSVSANPWGTRYGVNAKWLLSPAAMESGDQKVAGDGFATKLCNTPTDLSADRDVICLSGGSNKKYETSFYGNEWGGTTRKGDDFVYIIQGSQTASNIQ